MKCTKQMKKNKKGRLTVLASPQLASLLATPLSEGKIIISLCQWCGKKNSEDQLEDSFITFFWGELAVIFYWTGIYSPWEGKSFICNLVLRRQETPLSV